VVMGGTSLSGGKASLVGTRHRSHINGSRAQWIELAKCKHVLAPSRYRVDNSHRRSGGQIQIEVNDELEGQRRKLRFLSYSVRLIHVFHARPPIADSGHCADKCQACWEARISSLSPAAFDPS
jgi:hypothetical protein